MTETAIQFLERWRQAHVYAELRALEQLDETLAQGRCNCENYQVKTGVKHN